MIMNIRKQNEIFVPYEFILPSYGLKQGLLEKSKLAPHAYEEGRRIRWKEAKVLEMEQNTTHRKHKESAHMPLLDHAISQASLDISPVWTPVITAEVKKTTIPSSAD
jgi:hypothetical protein